MSGSPERNELESPRTDGRVSVERLKDALTGHRDSGAIEFWEKLRSENPERAYAMLAELKESLNGRGLGAILDLEAHANAIVAVAAASVSSARFLAGLMYGSQCGFFPVTYALLEAYPDDVELSKILSIRIVCQEGKTTLQDRFKRALKAVEGELDSWHTPNHAMPWLKEQLHKIHIRMSYIGA